MIYAAFCLIAMTQFKTPNFCFIQRIKLDTSIQICFYWIICAELSFECYHSFTPNIPTNNLIKH